MIPSFNLPQVFALRDKLVDKLLAHVGTQPTGPQFERLIDDLFQLMPKGLKYEIVYESCSSVLGTELTKRSLFDLTWRLSSGLSRLRLNEVVRPWTSQPKPEWMPVQVVSAMSTRTIKGDFGYSYTLQILAGSACPFLIYKSWPSKACSYIASKIGFSAPWKDSPYRDGHELVSTRFFVEVDPKFCRDNQPGFDKVHCAGALERWNKRLLKARAHIEPPCPYNFSHFCYQCPVGYDQCGAGCHPKTYESKLCQNCNQDTWHDPANQMSCVQCKKR